MLNKAIVCGLLVFSAALIFSSGFSIYRAIYPQNAIYQEQDLVRIEGKNCPLFFPAD